MSSGQRRNAVQLFWLCGSDTVQISCHLSAIGSCHVGKLTTSWTGHTSPPLLLLALAPSALAVRVPAPRGSSRSIAVQSSLSLLPSMSEAAAVSNLRYRQSRIDKKVVTFHLI